MSERAPIALAKRRQLIRFTGATLLLSVTPLGRGLMASMQAMIDWAETRMPEVAQAQADYDARSLDAH